MDEKQFSSAALADHLRGLGADLVGFARLDGVAGLDGIAGGRLTRGVSIALRLPREVVAGIADGPTRDYIDAYNDLNARLDALAEACERYLTDAGFEACALTRSRVEYVAEAQTRLPYKTVAVRAGLGWIGRSAMFVTERYGSAVRLTAVLTDAPLETAEPTTGSRCGGCSRCAEACPGHAITGQLWHAGMARAELFDPIACREKARALALERTGEVITLCGKCIEVCPYTRRYLAESGD